MSELCIDNEARLELRFCELGESSIPPLINFMRKHPAASFCPWENEALLRQLLMREQLMGCVALHGTQMVGAVLGGVIGVRGTINHLAVDDRYRRQGIGHQLVDKLCARFVAQGIRRIFLFSLKEAKPTVSFWSGLGFAVTQGELTFERDL